MQLHEQPLVKVHLHGILASKYGSEHAFAISTPREAIHMLDANYPGFRQDFFACERYGIIADGEERDGEAAVDFTFNRDLHIVPMIEGQAFIGTALVAAIIGPGIVANVLGSLLVLGITFGLSLLLRPKKPNDKKNEKDEGSYIFSGAENVTTQGVPVPIIYGRVFAGSVVISAGLSVNDVEIND